ncbi:unnamed protein product [Schistosoma curassoni]|uniref:Reverse transcriptase domain-containing protein n=1 Tax=Schistosoma curassoni TaxID=6186 RepID=A0A183KQQ1_9TREM|nr:unnamed protein product [Schistosoma curassoni]
MEHLANLGDWENQSNSNGNEEIQLGSTGNQRNPLNPSWTTKAKYWRVAAILRSVPMNPPDIEAAHTDLSIDVNPPTTQEIRMSIRQIKNRKAGGPDNILAEALKSDIEVTTNMLHLQFMKVWEGGKVPTNWKEGHLIKIPKKGDLNKCENYRGITPAKDFNRVCKM